MAHDLAPIFTSFSCIAGQRPLRAPTAGGSSDRRRLVGSWPEPIHSTRKLIVTHEIWSASGSLFPQAAPSVSAYPMWPPLAAGDGHASSPLFSVFQMQDCQPQITWWSSP
jgi:hypothetical protein